MNTLSRAQKAVIGIGTGVAMLAASFSPIGVSGLQAAGMPTSGISVTGTINYTSVPTVSTSPSSAAPGDSFGVSGSGFTPGDTVTIEFGGSTIGTATVDANGNFSTTATVPKDMPQGEHPLDVNGMTGVSKDLNYTVTAPRPPAPTPTPAPYYVPRVSSTPGSAPPGGTVTFTGTGFRPGEWVTISFGGSDIALGHADGLGEFSTTGKVPDDMPMGDHPIDANGDLGSSWDGDLGVDAPITPPPAPMTPKVGMAPGSGEPGQYVIFNGSDFTGGELVSIHFGGETIAMATTDDDGSFSASGMIPTHMPVGAHPIDATGAMGSNWDGNFTVLALSTPTTSTSPTPTSSSPTTTTTTTTSTTTAPSSNLPPRVGVLPGTAAAGEQITIVGDRFQAGEDISVEFGGGTIATATTDTLGRFRAIGRVPADMPAGAHPIEVTGNQGSSLEGNFMVTAPSTTTEQPATNQPTTTEPALTASNETATTSDASEATRTAEATTDRTSSNTSEASDTSNTESIAVIAGPKPSVQTPSEPATSKASTSETDGSKDSDRTSDARVQQSGDADSTSVATANQGGNSQLLLALIAIAGAMPLMAGGGWLLGTRRARQSAPRRRSW